MNPKQLAQLIYNFIEAKAPPIYSDQSFDDMIHNEPYEMLRKFAIWLEYDYYDYKEQPNA